MKEQLKNVGHNVRILAVDPGIETGYCYASILEKHLYYCPFQSNDDVDDFWRRIQAFGPVAIVMENFEFRGGARKGLELFPVQLIGVARLYSLIGPPDFQLYLQSASQGKSYYTDTILKNKELHIRGIPHGIDSSRHLLQWATFGPGYKFFEGERDFATIVRLEDFA